MPKYTESQIAVLTMPKEDLREAAGIIADWTGPCYVGGLRMMRSGRIGITTCPKTCGHTWRS